MLPPMQVTQRDIPVQLVTTTSLRRGLRPGRDITVELLIHETFIGEYETNSTRTIHARCFHRHRRGDSTPQFCIMPCTCAHCAFVSWREARPYASLFFFFLIIASLWFRENTSDADNTRQRDSFFQKQFHLDHMLNVSLHCFSAKNVS